VELKKLSDAASECQRSLAHAKSNGCEIFTLLLNHCVVSGARRIFNEFPGNTLADAKDNAEKRRAMIRGQRATRHWSDRKQAELEPDGGQPKNGNGAGEALAMWPVFSHLYIHKMLTTANKISDLSRFSLDISTAGGTIEYHLRSTSGSSGLEAEESSPLLGFRPILFLPSHRHHGALAPSLYN